MRKASIKSKRDIELLRESGRILVEALLEVAKLAEKAVETKITASDLDRKAIEIIDKNKAKPSFYGYTAGVGEPGFPGALCVSLNNEIVHGLPTKEKIIQEGDLLKIDLGVEYKNLFTDAAITVPIGNVSKEAMELARTTRKCLELGLDQIYPGSTLGNYGNAIEKYALGKGYGVVRNLVGHGVGYAVHEPPQIPNFGKPGKGLVLEEGMVLALEPMINLGTGEIELGEDGFAFVTGDGKISSHFEVTVAVVKKGHQVLTNWIDKINL